MPQARGGGREEQSHVQGAVAAWAPEGLEEQFHVQDREGQPCIQGVVAAQAQEGLEDLFHVQGQEGWR